MNQRKVLPNLNKHVKGKLAFYIFLFVELTGALAEDWGCLKAAFSLCNYRGLVKEPP
ncbi:hypothetical protein [Peribacillus butanolivorans]